MDFLYEYEGDDEDDRANWITVWPPDDLLAGALALELVLGRAELAVVFLTGLRAFPTGLQMTLRVRVRQSSTFVQDLMARPDFPNLSLTPPDLNLNCRELDSGGRPGGLEWGFEFADGTRVMNTDERQSAKSAQGPASSQLRPMLQFLGGSAGHGDGDLEYFLWPLPPPGRLLAECRWAEQGVELTTQELDCEALLSAASRARPLWPV